MLAILSDPFMLALCSDTQTTAVPWPIVKGVESPQVYGTGGGGTNSAIPARRRVGGGKSAHMHALPRPLGGAGPSAALNAKRVWFRHAREQAYSEAQLHVCNKLGGASTHAIGEPFTEGQRGFLVAGQQPRQAANPVSSPVPSAADAPALQNSGG
eukprot:scaffold17506_cov132-Isochrysis_galbana.AAC.10